VREHKVPFFGAVMSPRHRVHYMGKSGQLSSLWGLRECLRQEEQWELAKGCRKASENGASHTVCEKKIS